MKSVLISIQPKWCQLIANGKKTIEVRKTEPKLDTPFKAYIYCTANKQGTKDLLEIHGTDGTIRKANSKVIGEFVCDAVLPIAITYSDPNSHIALREFPYTCLTDKEIMDYLGNGKTGYGWHISDLVIYDKPRELGEFATPTTCNSHIAKSILCDTCCLSANFCTKKPKRIIRPPQSWCYVEKG